MGQLTKAVLTQTTRVVLRSAMVEHGGQSPVTTGETRMLK